VTSPKFSLLFGFLILSAFFAVSGIAGVDKPPRRVMATNPVGAYSEAVRVRTAKVLAADYHLLRKDFPQLRKLSVEQINEWLLKNGAYISVEQTKQTTVNTPIDFDPSDVKKTYRPKGYGRAFVAEVEGGGLLDAKGVGSLNPAQRHHRNGLATTGESLREFLMEKIVAKALKHAKSPTNTVGTYAVIDYGFDVVHEDGSKSPAGAVFRQANDRIEHLSQADFKRAHRIESTLRRYGITSAGDYRTPRIEATNIQTNARGDLIDFGAFLVVDKFEAPAVPYLGNMPDMDRVANGKGLELVTLLDPKDPANFPQPDSNFRIPLDEWAPKGKLDPKMDEPWAKGHEIADAYRTGWMNPEAVQAEMWRRINRIDEFMKPTDAAFVPPKAPSVFERVYDQMSKGALTSLEGQDFIYTYIRSNGTGFAFYSPEDRAALEKIAKLPRMHDVVERLKAIEMLSKPLTDSMKFRELAERFEKMDPSLGTSFIQSYLGVHPGILKDPQQAEILGRHLAEFVVSGDTNAVKSLMLILTRYPALNGPILRELNRPEVAQRLSLEINGLSGKAWSEARLALISELGISSSEKVLLSVIADAAKIPSDQDKLALVILSLVQDLPLPVQEKLLAIMQKNIGQGGKKDELAADVRRILGNQKNLKPEIAEALKNGIKPLPKLSLVDSCGTLFTNLRKQSANP
jgi:hypothetical protein